MPPLRSYGAVLDVVEIEDGEAVGMGKHEELLETCEVYREIYDSQFSKGGESK